MIYKETIISKNNLPLPVFANGKPMHSKYNPAQENLIVPQENNTSLTEGFFLIIGIGAGYHIKNLLANFLKDFSSYYIVAAEADNESLDYCKTFPVVKELSANSNIMFCTKETLASTLLQNYIPSKYGNFFILPQRAWQNENAIEFSKIEIIAKETLKNISNDYSVQAHFGKIWMSNILANLMTFKKNPEVKVNSSLTAAVIAAGPTLDNSIENLKKNRDSYCIIATDTTYSTLIKSDIAPDIVVSVDAQQVSTTHFYECPTPKNLSNPTIFIFDVCTNPAVPGYVKNKGHAVFFIQSGHPLSYIAAETACFPYVETGAGTVTIACCDVARLLGFKKIELFGADFAYSGGKPYAKGTYLETQFLSSATRIMPQETKFTALMYRTPLQKKAEPERVFTSEVLQRYEKTLIEWAKMYGYVKKEQVLENKSAQQLGLGAGTENFDFTRFVNNWIKGLKDKKYEATLLPYIAFLQSKKSKNISIFELYNLAYSKAIRYNR